MGVRLPFGESNSLPFDVDLILYLVKIVVFNNPTENCHIKGEREDWVGLPRSKSLFFAKQGTGFPIGNLTSQLFGNIYLDEFDHFVCEKLNLKYYGRYVDDMLFVHVSKEFLKKVIVKIRKFLQEILKLILHPKKIYLQHFKNGVAFLGTFIMPWRIYIGKRTKANFYIKIKFWNELILGKTQLNEKEIADFVCCMNSYLGIMKHYDSFTLRKKMIEQDLSESFWQYVGVSEKYEKVICLA